MTTLNDLVVEVMKQEPDLDRLTAFDRVTSNARVLLCAGRLSLLPVPFGLRLCVGDGSLPTSWQLAVYDLCVRVRRRCFDVSRN